MLYWLGPNIDLPMDLWLQYHQTIFVIRNAVIDIECAPRLYTYPFGFTNSTDFNRRFLLAMF